MARDKLNILQIIPADGWYARYHNAECTSILPVDNADRVVCWALVEHVGSHNPDDRYVVGLVHDKDSGTINPAEEEPQFSYYESIPDSVQ